MIWWKYLLVLEYSLAILADRNILLIKVLKSHQFPGKLSNLCQPREINYFLKKNEFLSQNISNRTEFLQLFVKT